MFISAPDHPVDRKGRMTEFTRQEDSFRQTRRAFVAAVPVAAATLIRCARSVYGPTRFAEAFVIDPSWAAYRPILHACITTLLPLEDPAFPKIAAESIEQRLTRLFPLEREQKFLGLQRTIVLFDQLDLFTMFSGPLLSEEMKARDVVRRGGQAQSVTRQIREQDEEAFRKFASAAGGATRFTNLGPDLRADYLELWRDSASIIKRQFFSAMKAMVMVTAYSMDEAWRAIGYAGPLIARRNDAP
jgi:hypothetical protein